jgi:hypothetical protein
MIGPDGRGAANDVEKGNTFGAILHEGFRLPDERGGWGQDEDGPHVQGVDGNH